MSDSGVPAPFPGNHPPSKGNEGKDIAVVTQTITTWAGPLPHPDALNKYNPATVRSIVGMAEKEQNDRHSHNRQEQQNSFLRDRRAQIFAFIIQMTALLGGIYLLANDKYPKAAIMLIAVALLMLVGAVAVGGILFWLQQRRTRADKPSEDSK